MNKHLNNVVLNNSNIIGLTYDIFDGVQCVTTNPAPQTYVLKVEQSDGSFGYLQVTKEEAQALGVCTDNTEEQIVLENVPTRPLKQKALIASKLGVNSNTNVNLKIVNNSIIIANGETNNCIVPKNEIVEKPLGSCENPIEIIQNGETLHSTQNLSEEHLQQIVQALQQMDAVKKQEEEQSKNYIYEYEIVYPEELDIKPTVIPPTKRGRPKKRPAEETPPQNENPPEPVAVKNVRTRSGRITRPPRYIEKDFKKIEIAEPDDMETVLKTSEFEPLRTNQEPTVNDKPVKTESLEVHQRKRQIAAQFRCPKCKKAYLGRSRMVKHLQQNPDHGPIPEHCKPKQDNETWNFLVDLAHKCPMGHRGLKFCKELMNLLKNAKILARVLFKQPMNYDKNLFYVDKNLSAALGVECGKYCLNDSELIKDVSIFTLLDNFKVEDGQNETDNISYMTGENNEDSFNGESNSSSLQENMDSNENSGMFDKRDEDEEVEKASQVGPNADTKPFLNFEKRLAKVKSEKNSSIMEGPNTFPANFLEDIDRNKTVESQKLSSSLEKQFSTSIAKIKSEKASTIMEDPNTFPAKFLENVDRNKIVENKKLGSSLEKHLSSSIAKVETEKASTIMEDPNTFPANFLEDVNRNKTVESKKLGSSLENLNAKTMDNRNIVPENFLTSSMNKNNPENKSSSQKLGLENSQYSDNFLTNNSLQANKPPKTLEGFQQINEVFVKDTQTYLKADTTVSNNSLECNRTNLSQDVHLENSNTFPSKFLIDPPRTVRDEVQKFNGNLFTFSNFRLNGLTKTFSFAEEMQQINLMSTSKAKRQPNAQNQQNDNQNEFQINSTDLQFNDSVPKTVESHENQDCDNENKSENFKVSFVDSIPQINLSKSSDFVTTKDSLSNGHDNLIGNLAGSKSHQSEQLVGPDNTGGSDFEMLDSCKQRGSSDLEMITHKPDSSDFHNRITLPSDLLTENSLLNTLSGSTDELITLSNVGSHHVPNFLDNSASSDEIMNVDQFVNERFKNLTEADLDLGNHSINLDLQSMDLFPFSSS